MTNPFRRGLLLAAAAWLGAASGRLQAQDTTGVTVSDSSRAAVDSSRAAADSSRSVGESSRTTPDTGAAAPLPVPVPQAAVDTHPSGPVIVDRVVAVVGNRPVLASQV